MTALETAGVSAVTATSDYGLLNRVRAGRPLDEIVVTSSLLYATRRKLSQVKPRVLLLATSQTGLLLPSPLLRRAAIRFDGLAATTRPAPRDTVTRALERRCLREALALLPYTQAAGDEAASLVGRRPTIVWPSPVRPGPHVSSPRRPGAVCYANHPDKKGLDLAVSAWAGTAPPAWPLFVTGLEEELAKRFLQQRGVVVSANVRFCGRLSEAEYRKLSSSVEIHLGASRVDEFATTQLEALLDGAMLVTVPSAGPIAPLALARELDRALVAPSVSVEGIAQALRHAFAMTDAERQRYRAQAQLAMSPFTREAFLERLRTRVLPLILAGSSPMSPPDEAQ